MSCIGNFDLCITRGDTFTLDVGLSDSWAEVVEDPDAYEAKLVFRDAQDDGLTPRLTLTVTPELADDAAAHDYPQAAVMIRFAATPTQTSTLPPHDLVAYSEIRKPDGSYVQRLLEHRVHIGD